MAGQVKPDASRERLRHIAPPTTNAHFNRLHSRIARIAKIGLPMIALAMLTTAFLWPSVRDRLVDFVSFVPIAINAATEDFQVLRLSIRGTDKHDRPYMFTAETAIKFDPNVEEVDLKQPSADMTLKDGTWLALNADRGLYLKKGSRLLMQDNVNLFHDQGYEMNTSSAWIDFENGEASGDEPVYGHGDFGELKGLGGFRVLKDGDQIVFKGPAHLKIYPSQEEAQ